MRGAAALRGEGQGGQRQAEEGVQERGAHIPLQIVLGSSAADYIAEGC